ncbi:MAG: hypothetical protein AAGA54_23640 [Myxococcota bacterium]
MTRGALCTGMVLMACAATPTVEPATPRAPVAARAPEVSSEPPPIASPEPTLPPLARTVGHRVPEPTPDTLSKGPCELGDPVVLGTAAHVRTAQAAFRDNGGLAVWYADAEASRLVVQPITLDGALESPATTVELGRTSGVAESLIATESGYLLLLLVPNAGSKNPGPDTAHLELIEFDHRGEVVGALEDVASFRWSGTAALGWYDERPVLFADEIVAAVDVATNTFEPRTYPGWGTVASGVFMRGDGRVFVMTMPVNDDDHVRLGWSFERAHDDVYWPNPLFIPDPGENYVIWVEHEEYTEMRLDLPVPDPELSWNGTHYFVSLGRKRGQQGELFLQPVRCKSPA